MRRSKLHQYVNEGLVQMDFLEANIQRSNDLFKLERQARELRRTLLQLQAEILDYQRED